MNNNQPFIPSELGRLLFQIGRDGMEATVVKEALNNLKSHEDNYELILEEKQS